MPIQTSRGSQAIKRNAKPGKLAALQSASKCRLITSAKCKQTVSPCDARSQSNTISALKRQLAVLQDKLTKFEPGVDAGSAVSSILNRRTKRMLFSRIKEKFDFGHAEQSREIPVNCEQEFIYDSVAHISSLYSLHNSSIWEGFMGATNSLRCSVETHLRCVLGVQYSAFCLYQSFAALDASRAALMSAYMLSGWTVLSSKDEQEKVVWQSIRDFIDHL